MISAIIAVSVVLIIWGGIAWTIAPEKYASSVSRFHTKRLVLHYLGRRNHTGGDLELLCKAQDFGKLLAEMEREGMIVALDHGSPEERAMPYRYWHVDYARTPAGERYANTGRVLLPIAEPPDSWR